MATPATETKRRDLRLVIDTFIEPEITIEGVVAVGSVATGAASANSDIDAIVFMHPIDRYIIPAESIWCPWDNTFHGIFVLDQRIQKDGIHLDLEFLDYRTWSDEQYDWPEEHCSGLSESWIAYDRHGNIAKLIADRTTYDDETRLARLDGFVLAVDSGLDGNTPESNWDRFAPIVCFRRLNVVRESIIGALFVYNRRWRFFPNRETLLLLDFDWLPAEFQNRFLRAAVPSSADKRGFTACVAVLRELANEILLRLVEDGLYGDDPGSEAFIRRHDEPGRAWNMDLWNEKHAARSATE